LKPGSTRYLASVSAVVLALAVHAPLQGQAKAAGRRANELALAGLRPGRDAIARAVRLYKAAETPKQPGGAEWTWTDRCAGQRLVVEADANRQIRTVRATEGRSLPGNCGPGRRLWRTGLGLAVGDPAPRVVKLYGEPESRSPGTRDGQQLELLYYAFDWAGPDVPQVMEVLCTVHRKGQPGRVVEITLAAASL
jgi:hypothetical protein